ncbi:ATPase, T2SS/T4P/T4SS family [Nanoarchaeota archaeon]
MAENVITSEVIREGEDVILSFNCETYYDIPSIEENSIIMAKTMEALAETPTVTKIVFLQKRNYEYDYHQTQLIVEIAKLYLFLVNRKDLISFKSIGTAPQGCTKCYNERYAELQNIIYNVIKSDPLGAYVMLRRIRRRERTLMERNPTHMCKPCIQKYLELLNYIKELYEKTRIITIAKPYLAGYKVGTREVYRKIFTPMIKPDFMFTKLMASYPQNAEEIDTFIIGDDTEVTVFKQEDDIQILYHIIPPEFKLDEDQYELLDTARNILAEHKPQRSEFIDPQRMRDVFFNVGKDLIKELATYKAMRLSEKEINKLTNILVRYTVGFGLIEVLLHDDEMQDISVNSPAGQVPIFIVHGKYDDCVTNIIPMKAETESWAGKLRMMSGRPLDEANPILDTELELPGSSIRVSAITSPLNPTGLAFSFRKHRSKPWTLPLFIKFKMLNPLAAGLISFIVDGTRTMLIAGTRSSGKTSFLTSIMVEIMRRFRVITIEDTLELPTTAMRKLGWNIQPMKVASALAKDTEEFTASDGIRATLRLGDSALIVGEVRSKEAVALYEAMRIGAAANVVAGTIHSDSPYGVFDRVVNDIGVPKTSFKASDLIIVANPIKSPTGAKLRRITQITEVRKHWVDDPFSENGFVDLFRYDAKSDTLNASDELINGDSEILKTIAANVKDFAGNWEILWQNIELRAKIKERQVKISEEVDDPDILEAPFTIKCNDMFHIISEKVRNKKGSLDSKLIYFEWNEWLKKEVRKRGKVQI